MAKKHLDRDPVLDPEHWLEAAVFRNLVPVVAVHIISIYFLCHKKTISFGTVIAKFDN